MGAEGDERLAGDRATSIGERDKHRTKVGREVVQRCWCLKSGQADKSTPPGDYHLICLTASCTCQIQATVKSGLSGEAARYM